LKDKHVIENSAHYLAVSVEKYEPMRENEKRCALESGNGEGQYSSLSVQRWKSIRKPGEEGKEYLLTEYPLFALASHLDC